MKTNPRDIGEKQVKRNLMRSLLIPTMKLSTRNVLLKAYAQLQDIIDELYEAHDRAIENNDFDDASLLASRADRLYQEAENLEIVITELEDR